MDRRQFIWGTSMAAVSTIVRFDSVMAQDPDYVIAETTFGKIRGIENRGIKIFKGIPYGASTTGANRFLPPVDPDKWLGVRDALHYGHSAPQTAPRIPKPVAPVMPGAAPAVTPAPKPAAPKQTGPSIFSALGVPGGESTGEGEDCLVLNVWTPKLNDGGKRPVMFWLHGGGFRGGSGSNPGWDGTNLCLRGDVVVITINHRVNVMGFADLSEFDPIFRSSGQAGMLDIVHALKWVKNNIVKFGGDPDRVMIFGQSGGGRKCETLLAMPAAKGLFHRAVIESGIAIKIVDKKQAVRNAEMLLAELGITKENVRDIQKRPLGDIIAAHYAVNKELGPDADLDTIGFSPSVNGMNIPQHPFYPTASALSPEVPIIIGHTRTEYTGLTTDAKFWHLDDAGLLEQIKKLLGGDAEEIIALYKKQDPDASPTDIFFLIQSDYRYGAATMKVAERRAKLGKAPVYLYYFAWESPVQGGLLRSPHNIEWPFAFDNAVLCKDLTGGGADAIALADKVSDAWIAFARSGNPNTPKMPHWPAYTIKRRETMVIDNQSKLVNDPLKQQREAMFKVLSY
jgi:para-nitrobenzyl esterase